MRSWKLSECCVALLLSASLGLAQPPATAPPSPPPANSEGSSEDRVRVSPFSFTDVRFRSAVSVFESVPPANAPTQNRLYLSPLCRLIPIDGKVKWYEEVTLG